jgi:periplasmic protein TonB
MNSLLLPRRSDRGSFYALALAIAAHSAIALLMPRAATASVKMEQLPTELVEVQLKPEPPPVVKEKPKPEPETKPTQAREGVKTNTPPPPAQAANVLTQREDPNAPADFSDAIIVGKAETYAGGASASTGTSKRAVQVARAEGTGSATTAPASAAQGPDLSKKARLAEGGSWACPFPAEADAVQVDHAVVGLRIAVSESGAAGEVGVTRDPGNGFGREARACARSKRYEAARDRIGSAITGSILVNVRFDR